MNSISSAENRVFTDAVVEVLNQGESLLGEIENEMYVQKLPAALNASIGAHYRHCLDHFRSLLDSASTGNLNYDHRERGTLVESDRFAALNATRQLRDDYQQLSPARLARELQVTSKTSYATDGSQSSTSTLGREIMYVVAHAIHHYALIGIMGGLMGIKLPPGFGVAPSTAKFQSDLTRKVGSVPQSN
jgi:uncharacterized damage-inducible protein DinB